MGSVIIDLISEFINITGNSTVDTIILALIGIISFSVAFGFVGKFFSIIGKYDKQMMSDLHWGIRVVIFLFLTFMTLEVVKLIKWLFIVPQLYYLIGIVSFVIILTIISLIVKKPKNEVESIVELKTDINQQKINNDSKNEVFKNIKKCPKCSYVLTTRKGPYGEFRGCTNYPKCNYTESL